MAWLAPPAARAAGSDAIGIYSEELEAANSSDPATVAAAMRAAGVGTVRQPFSWARIERSPGQLDFAEYDTVDGRGRAGRAEGPAGGHGSPVLAQYGAAHRRAAGDVPAARHGRDGGARHGARTALRAERELLGRASRAQPGADPQLAGMERAEHPRLLGHGPRPRRLRPHAHGGRRGDPRRRPVRGDRDRRPALRRAPASRSPRSSTRCTRPARAAPSTPWPSIPTPPTPPACWRSCGWRASSSTASAIRSASSGRPSSAGRPAGLPSRSPRPRRPRPRCCATRSRRCNALAASCVCAASWCFAGRTSR